MLWTDKYRPKTLDEVVGNNKEKALIQKWVDNWKAGNPQKPLLLVGPPGIGNGEIEVWNADDYQQKHLIPRMLLNVPLENHLPADHYLVMNTNCLSLMK